MLLWFEVSEGVIVRASYLTYGCPSAIASGSVAVQVLIGRRLEQAALLTAQDILLLLGGLPAGKEHCPKLVIDALKEAFRV
jgi:NifU-like protein involved in Fe-S cluster formation